MILPLNHSFNIQLACQYGVPEALVLNQIIYWIYVNINAKRNQHDGKTWTYQTLEDIADEFPYFSRSQVFDILYKLEHGHCRKGKTQLFEPVIIKGNYNKHKYDQTVWYSLVNESKFFDEYRHFGKSQTGNRDIPTPIPMSKPVSKPSLREVKDSSTPFHKIQEDIEESLTFANAKNSGTEKPAGTKFPLKKSQQPLFELLQASDLGCVDKTLIILIRSHSEADLIESLASLRNMDDRGEAPKKTRIAYIRWSLSQLKEPRSAQRWRNEAYARTFAYNNAWTSLTVKRDYSYCAKIDFEIPNTWHCEAFKDRLHEGFSKYLGE